MLYFPIGKKPTNDACGSHIRVHGRTGGAQMKSILWILNGCGLEGRGITGGPVRFNEISRRFGERGMVQHLLTTSGGLEMQTSLGCEIPATVVPASFLLKKEPSRFFRLWSYIVTSLLWRFWKSRIPRTDVIVTVSDYFCDIVPAIALKRKSGAKWIAWIHHCETDPKTRPGIRLVNEVTARMQRWSFVRIAHHADAAWISDSIAGDEIERRLLALGMPHARIRRMKDGIDVQGVRNAPEPPQKRVDAVMVGVRPNKGLYDIIPIWERVVARRPGTTLLLMGGMAGEAQVVEEIKRRGLPIEVFKPDGGGFLPAALYHAKMKEARILFAPSHEEGWGMAVCEAMASGLPVVAYDLPAYRQIYSGAYVAVSCFDQDAFADGIVKILDDAKLFKNFRGRGLTASANYDWVGIAEEDYEALNHG